VSVGPPAAEIKKPTAPIAQIEDARRGFSRPTDATRANECNVLKLRSVRRTEGIY
jgi:hypothetical protein